MLAVTYHWNDPAFDIPVVVDYLLSFFFVFKQIIIVFTVCLFTAHFTNRNKTITNLSNNRGLYSIRWGRKIAAPACWYSNFAKLCHTMIIFGVKMHRRISHQLPV